jgi:dTDP-D-glucose 4,6-dehydratase
LISDKAFKYLGWRANWDFEKTIKKTADWYFEVDKGACPFIKCLENIKEYNNETF